MSGLPDATAPSRTRLGWVLGLTSTAYFMVVLDSVVVITALPRMQRDLKVSLSSLQWTLNAYGIAFAAGIITVCRPGVARALAACTVFAVLATLTATGITARKTAEAPQPQPAQSVPG
jgi:MFS family permease